MLDPSAMRAARKRLGMSRDELAARLNRTPLTVRRWETGKATPNDHSVTALAVALDVDARELVADE
ncbi:Helix-turn-helix domain-containing protein [Nocardiopsis flavescens]|uniref:Helix-turn-helix domain-containing protein n=1 Tax=Nocardiopsis flavescens TaxID=758803 RepID=A0A1M6KG43_9ACTN|nr:helix-turn-helix transcriptional regulator [Nocardiopsis flavescens]SHJ57923.1 Helix-turn-helix domain-containing protein [Nocardiopsis flavescens]